MEIVRKQSKRALLASFAHEGFCELLLHYYLITHLYFQIIPNKVIQKNFLYSSGRKLKLLLLTLKIVVGS